MVTDGLAGLVSSPWWVVVAGAIPSLASGLWVVWRWQAERRDKKGDGDLSREERGAREMESQRATLSQQQAALFDRLVAECSRHESRSLTLERERDEMERDRDRGWDLARWWKVKAHELRHDLMNARCIIDAHRVARDLGPVEWPDSALPGLEAPIPKV